MSLPSIPEGYHGSEIGPEYSPAEGGHWVNTDQTTDEGVLTALEECDDVWPHVVRVLLSEVLGQQVTQTVR